MDYAVGSNPHSIVAGDFNGDGTLDLAVNWTAGHDQRADGPRQRVVCERAAYAAGPVPAQLAVADLNGDGIPDLAVANHGVGGGSSVTIGVLLGKGDGTFMARQALRQPRIPTHWSPATSTATASPTWPSPATPGAGTTVALFATPRAHRLSASYSGLSDGVWYFHVRAVVDTAGGGGPTATRAVRIATAPPAILAQRGGGTKRHTITLRYRVNDVTPLATSVSVVIRNARHRVVATFTVGTVTTGRWHTVRWVPTARSSSPTRSSREISPATRR